MGGFFGFIFGLYVVVALLSSPYFWAKRTDRSQTPIARRFTAMAYGFTWPYVVVQYFMSKQAANAGSPPAVPTQPSAPLRDPFES